jgi:hypothetical protein
MERDDLFDALTVRGAAVLRDRRAALGGLGRVALALLGVAVAPGWGPEAAASQLVKGCKLPGQKCSGKQDCCAPKCTKDHRCGCINKGKKPLVKTPLGPVPVKALCCTNKLNKLKGTCK